MIQSVAIVFGNTSLMTYLSEWLCPDSMAALALTHQDVHLQYLFLKQRTVLPWRSIFQPTMFTTETLFRMPVLDIGRMRGHTDYIDFIQSDMMKTAVMKGIDVWRRPFMVLRFSQDGHQGVITVFKRYTDSHSTWVTGGAHIVGYEGVNVVSAQHPLLSILKSLLEHGECSYMYTTIHDTQAFASLTLVN